MNLALSNCNKMLIEPIDNLKFIEAGTKMIGVGYNRSSGARSDETTDM